MMKAMKKYILGFVIAVGLWACSKEDWPSNDQFEVNFFAVPEDATGEEAELRREFFVKTGVYLLFSDTLGCRNITTLSGKTVIEWQVIDFMWNMSSGTYYVDSLEFFPYQVIGKKEVATKFVQDELLSDLPELFYPYSILLMDRLVFFDNFYGTYVPSEVAVYSGMQATAIALGDIATVSDEEKETLKNEIMKAMIVNNLSLIKDGDLAVFYSYSTDYYDISSWNVPSPVESVGFLPTYVSSWTVTFNSKSTDVLAYVEEIFNLSETEFRETYAEYPVVIEKMEEMVNVLRKYGVNVY